MANAIPLDLVHEVRQTCLCLATQRAARMLARRFDRAFRPVGLTNGQFSLMMPLNVPDPMRLGQLAAFLAMDRTTLTAALKSLERRGLVQVSPDETDHRARRLSLTEAGRETLAAALPIWRAEHAALEAELSTPNAAALRALLPTIKGAGDDLADV
ncbi:MAG: MarR family transcriptional regulator [Beijerinckiaceae bacterium]|nr:MarR family transcriptional regulator [Beijerinckiaceae bacterium]